VLGTWELYLVGLAFAGMAVVAWVLVAVGTRGLTVERRVSPGAPLTGDPLRFEFTLTTRWRLPGLHVEVREVDGGVPDMPESVVIEDLGVRRERMAVAGPRPARRGVYRLPELVVAVEDPMGLVRARRTAGERLTLTVAPRLRELTACAPCAQTGARHGGGRRRLPTRNAWEFRGIRPHTPGEPVERVDWKSTAKTGSLMLRETEADTENDLTVLLHAPSVTASGRGDGDAPGGPDEAFEAAVVAAGSMAAFALRSGHAVSLLLPDTGWREQRLRPDSASRRRLLTALAEVRPRGTERLGASLPAILTGRSRTRRRVLTIVTTRVDPDLVAGISRLRGERIAVSVVHIVSHGATSGAARDGENVGPALTAAGARYFPITPADDLGAALAGRSPDRMARVR